MMLLLLCWLWCMFDVHAFMKGRCLVMNGLSSNDVVDSGLVERLSSLRGTRILWWWIWEWWSCVGHKMGIPSRVESYMGVCIAFDMLLCWCSWVYWFWWLWWTVLAYARYNYIYNSVVIAYNSVVILLFNNVILTPSACVYVHLWWAMCR